MDRSLPLAGSLPQMPAGAASGGGQDSNCTWASREEAGLPPLAASHGAPLQEANNWMQS